MARPKKDIETTDNVVELDRGKAAQKAMAELNKKYGKNTISEYSNWESEAISCIPSGSIALDKALGGGYPRGRIVEIYAENSVGKTSAALHAAAEVQKLGGVVAFLDLENALDMSYAKKLGVNVDTVLLSQPDYGEQAFEIVETLLRANAVDLIIIDSVSALIPQKELEGEMGASQMGSQARLMSQGLRKITGLANKSKCVVFFINQTRKSFVMYGDNTVTSGGQALKFYASQRLHMTKGKPILNGDVIIGNKSKIKIVKNKIAPPFRLAEFDMIHGIGIDRVGEVLDFAVSCNIVEKSGGSHSYNGESLGRSRDKSLAAIKDNPALQAELEKLVYSAINNGVMALPTEVEVDEDGVPLSNEEDEE